MRSIACFAPAAVAGALLCLTAPTRLLAQTPAPPAAAAPKPRPSPTGGARPVPRVNPKLKNPALCNEKAPEIYKAKFTTTKGDFVVSVNRSSAPIGADRFYNLVKIGFFSDVYFFRMLKGFVAQFGIPSDPSVAAVWTTARLKDEPVKDTNKRGTICFAKTDMPDTRTTQLFINLGDNNRLDAMGFAPFATIVEGMDVVDKLNLEYADTPDQGAIQTRGGAYLSKEFPRLDKIVSAVITDPPPVAPAKPAPPKPAAPKPAAPKPAAPKPAAKQP